MVHDIQNTLLLVGVSVAVGVRILAATVNAHLYRKAPRDVATAPAQEKRFSAVCASCPCVRTYVSASEQARDDWVELHFLEFGHRASTATVFEISKHSSASEPTVQPA